MQVLGLLESEIFKGDIRPNLCVCLCVCLFVCVFVCLSAFFLVKIKRAQKIEKLSKIIKAKILAHFLGPKILSEKVSAVYSIILAFVLDYYCNNSKGL